PRLIRLPAGEGLEDREEDAAVLRHAALLPDRVGADAHQRVVWKGGEGVVGLIGEDVAVCEEQNARPARRLATPSPSGMEQLPGDLEGDEGLAGTGGEVQQDAVAAIGDGVER